MTRGLHWGWILCGLFMALLCRPGMASAGAGRTDPVLRELRSIEELGQLFDRDKGVPRLVLLLSPT